MSVLKTKLVLFVAVILSISAYSQKKWTLKECVDHALENNITIKQNKINIDLADKDKDIAKGNFLPNLNGTATQGLSFGSLIGADGSRISRDTRSNSFGLSSSTTLFNGYRNLNSYKQSKLGVEASKLDLEVIENDISLRVVNTYLNVLFAKENLNVATVQSDISKKQIEQFKTRFDAGAIPKSDLLNAQSSAANDLQNVITQENALNLALLNLSQLLQVPFDGFDVTTIKVDSPSAAMLYSSSEEVYKKALTNRPEIERARLNLDNADLNIEIAKGRLLPTLSFSTQINTSYQTILGEPDTVPIFDQNGNVTGTRSNGFFTQLNGRLGYNFGLNLSIPIFNRFQTKNQIEKTTINKEITELQLENQKLQLQQTIEQAFQDSKAAAKAFEAAEISLEAQNEAFKNAQESYNYGAMTLFDFDLVRSRLVNAEGAMIRAKYNYVFTTKVLKFYYGEDILLD